ncbi:MAG: hypothetical protein HDS03_00275 [Bacteroides sp.]|nr:hypothetical protein [Bacteroides sp.]
MEKIRNYTRRCNSHDYCKPATYHIILHKATSAPDFGALRGNPMIPYGKHGNAYIYRSPLGRIIDEEIYRWPEFYPSLKVFQHIVMPDHVHILVRVLEKTPKKFGFYVNKLKVSIKIRWNEANGHSIMPPVFLPNYTDRIIFPWRSIQVIIEYIRWNPHRLAMRHLHPEFFRRSRPIMIEGRRWQAYGNLFLLRNPFKDIVRVSRRATESDRERMKGDALFNTTKGGVAVSPFISEGEKQVRDAIEEAAGRMIHIQEYPFPERFKPERRRFDQCCEGRLLILAPMESLAFPSRREECLHLNQVALAIAEERFTPL